MQLVSISLSILSLSILFQSFNFVLTRAFFAIENTKIPFMVNIIGLIFLVFSGNLVFSGIITDFSIEEKFFIISALYSFVFLLISIFLFILLKVKMKKIKLFKNIGLKKKILVNVFTFSIIYFLYTRFYEYFVIANGQLKAFVVLSVYFTLTIILFFIISKIFKEEEYLKIEKKILKKIHKK